MKKILCFCLMALFGLCLTVQGKGGGHINIISPGVGWPTAEFVGCTFDVVIESDYPIDSIFILGHTNQPIQGSITKNYEREHEHRYSSSWQVQICGYDGMQIPAGSQITISVTDENGNTSTVDVLTSKSCPPCENQVADFKVEHSVEPPMIK